jgi:hypothetical protein
MDGVNYCRSIILRRFAIFTTITTVFAAPLTSFVVTPFVELGEHFGIVARAPR